MAYSQEQWEKAKEYYEAGLSLSEINLRTEISRPQISKKAKKESWEKGNKKKQLICDAIEVEEKKKQILETKETLSKTAIEIHNEIVDEEVRRRGLIFNASELLVKKTTELIKKNQTVEKVNIGDGVQQFEPRELNSTDYKNIAETIDKASVTLGVNQRRANSQVSINNTNAQQTNNEIKVEWE